MYCSNTYTSNVLLTCFKLSQDNQCVTDVLQTITRQPMCVTDVLQTITRQPMCANDVLHTVTR